MTQRTIRDEGLENHFGSKVYAEFVRLLELGASDTLIAKAINRSRRRVPYYKEIYREELTKNV